MANIIVKLVKYDMDKTKKRKRSNFSVDVQTEDAVISKLEKIHKGEKVQAIHEIVWGAEEQTETSEICTGIVKFFDAAKGFGFIQADDNMDDLFFHSSALNGKEVLDQDVVQFEISNGKKGDVAIHIKVIE